MARVDPGAPNQAALLFLGMNAYPSPIGPARMDDHGYWRICIRVKDGCWKIRYLPDCLPGEVEIARIELKSTTGDVISVRARPLGRTRIAYRVIDEYPEDWTLSCSPKTSRWPLSLGKLISLLDTGKHSGADLVGGFSLGYNDIDGESSGRANLRHFTRISSDVYRSLEAHYEHVFEEWVAEEGAGLSEKE